MCVEVGGFFTLTFMRFTLSDSFTHSTPLLQLTLITAFLCTPLLASGQSLPERDACLADVQSCYEALGLSDTEANNNERYERAMWLCDKEEVAKAIKACNDATTSSWDRLDCEQRAQQKCTTAQWFEARLEALELESSACNTGHADSCIKASLMLSAPHVTDESLESTSLYIQEFPQHNPTSTEYSSISFIANLSTPHHRLLPEPERARQLLEQGCARGSTLACEIRDNHYPVDNANHANTLEKLKGQCSRGEQHTCKRYTATFLLEHGATYAPLDGGSYDSGAIAALRTTLASVLEQGCQNNNAWACDQIFRKQLMTNPGHDVYYGNGYINEFTGAFSPPDAVHTLAQNACKQKTGELGCVAVDSACLHGDIKCSKSRAKQARKSLSSACKQGHIEACHALYTACEQKDPSLCEAITLPKTLEEGVAMCSGKRLMCQKFIVGLDALQDSKNSKSQPTTSFLGYGRVAKKQQEVTLSSEAISQLKTTMTAALAERAITQCTEEALCTPDNNSTLSSIYYYNAQRAHEHTSQQERYRAAIKTQCLEKGRACENWLTTPRSAEEIELTDKTLAKQCNQGQASSCLLASTTYPVGATRIALEEKYCALLDASSCPRARYTKALDTCISGDFNACTQDFSQPLWPSTLLKEDTLNLGIKQCQLGDVKACIKLTSADELPLELRRNAYVHLCRSGENTDRNCARAIIATSANKRFKELKPACLENRDDAACIALNQASKEPTYRFISKVNEETYLHTAAILCDIGYSTYCKKLIVIHDNAKKAPTLFPSRRVAQEAQTSQKLIAQFLTKKRLQGACKNGVGQACRILLSQHGTDKNQVFQSAWTGCKTILTSPETRYIEENSSCEAALELNANTVLEHLKKECDTARTSMACANYGEVNQLALRIKKQHTNPKVISVYTRACKKGSMADCFASAKLVYGEKLAKAIGTTQLHAMQDYCSADDNYKNCTYLDEQSPKARAQFMELCKAGKTSFCPLTYTRLYIDYLHGQHTLNEDDIHNITMSCQQGDAIACTILVDQHDPRIFQYKRNRTMTEEPTSEDLAQRDRYIDMLCETKSNELLCGFAQSYRGYLSKDPAQKQQAYAGFKNFCAVKLLKINASDIMRACEHAAELMPHRNLSADERAHLTALWFLRNEQAKNKNSNRGVPALEAAWLHPGVAEIVTTIAVYSQLQDLSIMKEVLPLLQNQNR